MAFTGVLGSIDSGFGQFALGRVGALVPPPSFDQTPNHTLNLTQVAHCEKTLNLGVTQTLTLTQRGGKPLPLVPIVGYTGGQTRYVYVHDITDDYPLYALNEDDAFIYPASVTKLMTVLLVLEQKAGLLDSESVTFNSADVSLPGGVSNGGFQDGDICTWRELLIGIVVASAGDACQCAARILGHKFYTDAGSTGNDGNTRFIEEMNNRAAVLNMTDAIYWDSWGTSGVGKNQMTARSLFKLMRELLVNQASDIMPIFGLATYSLAVTGLNPRSLPFAQVNYFINGPVDAPAGIADVNEIGGKVGEWNGSGSHLNLVHAQFAPNGNIIVYVTMNSETYYAMQLDQQGIIYATLRDWPYLIGGTTVANDIHFTDVRLLVGADLGATDISNYGHTVTANNTFAAVTKPILAEKTKSFQPLARNSNLDVADLSDMEIGANDATVETWYAGNGGQTSAELVWFGKFDSALNREYTLNYSPSSMVVFASSDTTNWTTSTMRAMNTEERNVLQNGAIRHIALVKSGSTIYGFINGERMGSISMGTIGDSSAKTTLGSNPTDSITALGNYDDWRVTIGTARYTAAKHTLVARPFPRSAVAITPSSNALTIHQVAVGHAIYNRSAENTLTFTQHAYRTHIGIAESTLTVTHTVEVAKLKRGIGSNTLVPTQTLSRVLIAKRDVQQGMALVHALTRTVSRVRVVPQTLTIGQSAVGISSKKTSNDLTFTQLAEATVGKHVRQFVELTQSVAVSPIYNRPLLSVLVIGQVLRREISLQRQLTHTLPLTQVAIGNVVKNAKNLLVFTQSVQAYTAKPTGDFFFDLTQSVSVSKSVGRTTDDFVSIFHEVAVQKSKAADAHHYLGFNQFARGTKRITVAASNHLNLVQDLVRDRTLENVPHTLALSQTVAVSKLASPRLLSTLVLSDSVSVSKTIVRAVGHTLVFQNSFQRYIGIGSGIGTGSGQYVTVPAIQVVKVKQIVVLQSDSLVVTLPAPEFNDSEAGTGRINIKRTMAGGRRVYKRDNLTSKLNYNFVIDRRKAIELRNFILNSNSKVLRMENWKGEIWYVQMVNSPFSFGEDAAWLDSPGGNKSSITLEFEGARVN